MRIDCEHLTKAYDRAQGELSALENVTFSVADNEFISIVGPSGCGKTTLLKIIAGLLEPTSGTVRMSGVADGERLVSALVFQDHGLFPWLTVLDNVAFGLEMIGIGRSLRHEQARAFIERVGLAHFADSYPDQLSVGMRQRVGIVRAFVTNTPLLLMDEPFGALDSQTRLVLQEELLRIWEEHRKVVVFVTHDIDEAIRLSDRILVMSGRPGRILEEVPVPLERPRVLARRKPPEVADIKWHIWGLLEEEVRRSLWVAG
jgi:NitT/TauT family transport system ATP-binding protein